MWGSVHTNCSGRSLVEALDVHDSVVLNTAAPTHLSLTGRNAWSLLDLVFVSSSCTSLCTSTVTSEFLESDHSVVLTAVKANTMPEDFGVPKWQNGTSARQTGRNLAPPAIKLYVHSPSLRTMLAASLKPMFAKLLWKLKRSLKVPVPWCNKQCDITVKNKKHAFNGMKRTWLLRDIMIFKRCRAKARRVILEAKSSPWGQSSTSLTPTTNLSKVWKVIKSFSGKRSPYFVPTLHA